MTAPILSVIIPVYNEEQTLPLLFGRLYPALDSLNVNYEVLFVSDGSRRVSGETSNPGASTTNCAGRYPESR